jgi:hypothetical protein
MPNATPMDWVVQPPTARHFSPEEAGAFMATWTRIAAWDGSTVAYIPDAATARLIVRAVSAHDKLMIAARATAEMYENTDSPMGSLAREALRAAGEEV